ncbi:hypothetical protein [Sporomusa aerivorans]|uniref:hypothetical protein n=1 Tax=Sporomusa aerivorans TaxID=204936 RepID=UPI003529EFB2
MKKQIRAIMMLMTKEINRYYECERYITVSREKMLNRELIVPAIKKYCLESYKEFTVSDLIHKGGYRYRVEIEADGTAFFVDFHFRANGSTSIDISSGQHVDRKKQIKDAILGDPACLLVR